jgi:hypothetical protein
MTALSAAGIGDIAREQLLERLKKKNKQLLAQRRKPQAPPPASAGVSTVTELALEGRSLTDVEELGFFTELKCAPSNSVFACVAAWRAGSLPPCADLRVCVSLFSCFASSDGWTSRTTR